MSTTTNFTTPLDGVSVTGHGTGTGLMLTPSTRTAALEDLLHTDLLGLLADAGHLLLRGFTGDVDQFNRLVAAHSGRLSLDPAREFHGDVAQKVDSGTEAIGLHLENGATPFVPDLVWFYSVKAAASGSQTTVCDGYRVWEALSGAAKDRFLG
ncbi:TauD/TfdA family dioxygenase, partial [Pseudonocardia sp. KRD291]|uniref:TauD/TfdA family dioxygenase n=1 Tax=Pseudonocardia sp. KRD291 TaxID=2792007 RepID=UPI001C4A3B3B